MADSAMTGTPLKPDAAPESFLSRVRRTLASPLHMREFGVFAALI